MTNSTSKLNSHNEWDKLKEVIVGSAEGTQATLSWNHNSENKMTEKNLEKAFQLAEKASPKWFYDEVSEDLNNLSQTLQDLGVVVHRPEIFDFKKVYSTPEWSSTSNNIYNTRDLNLVVGDNLIESPSHRKNRYFESSGLYPIFYKYFEKGCKWISAPKPRLNYEAVLPYYRDESERVLTDEDKKHKELTGGRVEKLHKLSEQEILFEAANTLRMGKDLLYLVSSSGNYKGAKWLQDVLGDSYNVHVTKDIYRSSHIDSTLMVLKPGLILMNSIRVNEKNCPKMFEKWDKLYFNDVAPTSEVELKFQNELRDPIGKQIEDLGFKSNLFGMASPWVGMNVLSIDPETVLVDERQKSLIKLLEKNKIKVVTIKMRHIYTQGGGLHCATLDTVRESILESYFD